MSGGNKFYSWLQRWLDEFRLAFVGAGLAIRKKRFVIAFLVAFVIFGTLLNFLSSGDMAFQIMSRAKLAEKIGFLFNSMISTVVIRRSLTDYLFILFMTILQSTLIGLVVFVYKYRKDSANLQNAGIITGLLVLSSGCPTCGTTILAPIIISIAGSSGMAVAGTVSWVLTILSIIVALLALKKVGFEAYAIIKSEEYLKKPRKKPEKAELDSKNSDSKKKAKAKKVVKEKKGQK